MFIYLKNDSILVCKTIRGYNLLANRFKKRVYKDLNQWKKKNIFMKYYIKGEIMYFLLQIL